MKILLVSPKIIKDPVHGYVEVDEKILQLLDAPAIQRLRYIHQLGFSYLVYPGANHTRFEHSVGTMHLAGVACRQFGLEEDDRLLVMIAALLHDVGHGPFSHASEPLMESRLGRTHDDIVGITETQFGALLEPLSLSPTEICDVVKGRHRLSGIIHGDLDVDRMDYLLRDAYYTGAPYGTVDAHRLIRNLHLTPDGIALDENGINAAESLLIARTLMRPTVYYHHVSRIGECMFQLAVLAHMETGPVGGFERFCGLDDWECMHELKNSPSSLTREITARLYRRQLYKRAVYAGQDQVNAAAFQNGWPVERAREVAGEIAGRAGCHPSDVLVDIPPVPGEMSLEVQVKNRHTVVGFAELSPRLQTLNQTRREQWRLGVYTLPQYRDAVADASAEILHIKKPTRQETLF
ncbi:HD domain-containing protein [Methanoregula sp.]|uniref:HD domain-containing protein n=1 Tax=Methanoregula sp. TaxID=2052170 RepID=UPI003BAF4EC7